MFMLAADAKRRPAPRMLLPLEPTPTKTRWLGALSSLAVHGVTVGAFVLLTLPHSAPATTPRTIDLRPILPAPPGPVQPDPAPAPGPIDRLVIIPVIPPVDAPTGIPPIPETALDWTSIDQTREREIAFGAGQPSGLGAEPGAMFEHAVVDEPPVLLSSPRLEYPRHLLDAGIDGTVMIEVVIDTLGRAERETIRVVWSPHAALSASARDVIARALYRPGRLGGQRVRVLVQLPVVFIIER
jgi:TonB family protein